MGKALLVIVLGSGLILTTQLYNASQQERETNEDQADYQEEVIAREIAQSAFNVGMGVLRSHGEKLQQGVVDLNGTSNTGRSGTHNSGRFAGGEYEVKAELTSGHSVRVVATGRYGDAEFSMHDEYRVPVLIARHDGLIDVSFLESMAGYCSAVFYQAYTLDMEEGEVPEPIMLFPPQNRNQEWPANARPAQAIYVEAGTQMNFFIAVDENCDLWTYGMDLEDCSVRKEVRDFVFDATKFDHIHYALEVKAGELDQAEEAVWGLTEQHPTNRQRWRISWEDLDRPDWNQPNSEDPTESMQALKRFGYDLVGWPTADANGYRVLEDFGDRPDFSDQVIEVEVIRASHPNFFGKMTSARAKQANCGEHIDDPVADPPIDPTAYTPEVLEDIADILAEDGAMDAPDPDADDAEEQLAEYACECTNNGSNTKRPLLHRPPGNEANEQLLCLPQPARANAHLRNHNDIELSCQVRQNIQANNGKKK